MASVVRRLELESPVDFAQRVYRYRGLAAAQHDYSGKQYGPGQIRADLARRHSDGSGVRVAVIDTGIDKEHSDLRGRVIRTRNFTDDRATSRDIHGTLMAGIIAAVPRNGFGIDGVAPGARIISIKVLKQTSPSGETDGSSVSVSMGIDYAILSKAHVINMSYGSPKEDPTVARVVKAAISRGIVVVVAAGNDGARGRLSYPAAVHAEVIAVSAVDNNRSPYLMGTRGDYIDVAAPGVDVLSTGPGDTFQYSSGTSAAAAHVTGVVALLLSKRPRTPPSRIKAVLEETATDLDPGGRDIIYGSGLVDACKAMGALVGRGGLCM